MQSKGNRRKLWLAILGSIAVHILVALSLAAFSGAPSPPVSVEDKPPELTFVDLAPTPAPLVPKNPQFIETNPAKASAEKPKEQTFESNENSIAASDVPARGEAPVPSQDGKDRPFMNFETQQVALPTDGKTAQPDTKPTPVPVTTPAPKSSPSPKPSEAPKASPTPPPLATPEPEQFAMLSATPPPPIKPPDEPESSVAPTLSATPPPPISRPRPEAPASSYQAQKEQTRVSGRISNRGPSAVNAVGTPMGRYQKAVSDAIGARWYYYMSSKMDLVNIGTAHVEAEVDAQGHVQKLRVLSNNANEAFANICLQSFQDAKLPPIPPDLIAALPDGRMPVDFYFTTYSNR